MTVPLNNPLKPGLVSIMMPAYNAEKFVRAAIESVLSQTYPLWELILVNDGSTDQTEKITREFTDPRIRLFHQENAGEAAARNHALTKIQGEFLAFLDADDLFHPSFLALMVSYLNQHPEKDAVYCDGYYMDTNDKVLSSLSNFRRGPFEGDLFEQLVRASDVFGPPMTVMLRSDKVISSNIQFDPRIVIGPDWDFFTHLSQFMIFGHLNRQLCFYRVHQTNITLTAGNARKNHSLALCRLKMIDLPRFNDCKEEVRVYVFYDLMVNLISEELNSIEWLLSHPSFNGLSPCEQSRLIRLTVIKQIFLHSGKSATFKKWLKKATSLCPNDQKTNLVRLFYSFSPSIFRLFLNLRETLRPKNAPASPFSS
ncbi:glycosyltransferase family 2 protein [Bellilinea sp.]